MGEHRLPRDTVGVLVAYRGPGRKALRAALMAGWRVLPWGSTIKRIKRVSAAEQAQGEVQPNPNAPERRRLSKLERKRGPKLLVVSRIGTIDPWGCRRDRRASEGRDWSSLARRDWLLTLSELRKQGLKGGPA